MKPAKWLLILIMLTALISKHTNALTVGEERDIGAKAAAQIIAASRSIEDIQVKRYIQSLGNKLVKSSGPSLFTYNFYVLSDSEINAFALPGGYIFINSGLILLAQSEDELASVIAHEIAHVQGRHISRQIDKMQIVSLGTIAAVLAAIFAGPNAQTSTALGAAAIAAGQTVQLSYSREQEDEADRVGATIMASAGYNLTAMAQFFERLLQYAPEGALPAYLSTHPALNERVSRIKNLAASQKPSRKERSEQTQFLKAKLRIEIAEGNARALVDKYQGLLDENKDTPLAVCYMLALALAYKKYGQISKAEEIFKIAEKEKLKDADLLREWGKLLFEQGKLDEAREKFNDAKKLDPADPENLLFLGLIEEEKFNPQAAVDLFKKVLKLQPEWDQAIYHLGINYGRTNDQCLGYYYLGRYEELQSRWNTAYRYFREAKEQCANQAKLVEEIEERMKKIVEIVGATQ